jgi:hypothetical protein
VSFHDTRALPDRLDYHVRGACLHAVSFEHIGHNNRQARSGCLIGNVTEPPSHFASPAMLSVSGNSLFKLEFYADPLDLSIGLFEPLLVRRVDESGIVRMLGRANRENVSQSDRLARSARPCRWRNSGSLAMLTAMRLAHRGSLDWLLTAGPVLQSRS